MPTPWSRAVSKNYPDTLRPALQVIGVREGIHKVSAYTCIITRKGDLYFLADATVNIEPSAEDLAEIALCAAQEARRFDVEPRVAMLSFSSFGSTKHQLCDKVRRAVPSWRGMPIPRSSSKAKCRRILRSMRRRWKQSFPFSSLKGGGQRSDLPRSAVLQYRLQTTSANWAQRKPSGRSCRAWQNRYTCCNAGPKSKTWSISLPSRLSMLRIVRVRAEDRGRTSGA